MIRNNLRHFLILLIITSTFLINTQTVSATVEIGEIKSYGITYINYFMNHAYLERDKPYLYHYSAISLDQARQRLTEEGKIAKLPVVIEVPSELFENESKETTIERKAGCNLSYGETGGNPPVSEMEECYFIYYTGNPSHQAFLALLINLSRLTENEPKKIINDQEKLIEETGSQFINYQGEKYYSKPLWSPDSRFVAFGTWSEGIFNYEVYDTKRSEYLISGPLISGVAAEPVWSHDSRYLAFASLSEVKIFDAVSGVTTGVDLKDQIEGAHLEVLLSYDLIENKFLYAFDTNLLMDYKIYEYDPKTNKTEKRGEILNEINWREKDLNNFTTVTSPDGRYEAEVMARTKSVTKLPAMKEPSVVTANISDVPANPDKGETIDIQIVLLSLGAIVLYLLGLLTGKFILSKPKKCTIPETP